MPDPYLGEIALFPFNFAPQGWALCNGQLLPINQNQALFAILGTTYGGDGKTTFALPDLRGRVPVHQGSGVMIGESAGAESHTLTVVEMPAHTHAVSAGGSATTAIAAGHLWGAATLNLYGAAPNVGMNEAAIKAAGGSQAHPNMQPYLALNYCIALTGIFPSRS